MSQPFAIVRDGREVLAAGRSLDEAMALGAESFYSSTLPVSLEVLQGGKSPLPSLVAVPCSEGVLLAAMSDMHDAFGVGAVTIFHGILCLEEEVIPEDEDQLSLF